MSRRDTIILAVLINVGLLAILFFTARNSSGGNDYPVEPIPQLSEMIKDPNSGKEQASLLPKDEVDLILEKAAKSRNKKSVASSKVTDFPLEEEVVSSEKKDYVEVTVKNGDYLERIARLNGTTVKEIMRRNNMKDHRLKVGQVLKVPLPKEEKKVVKKEKEVEDDVQYYVVQSGDNPWLIAIRHRIPLEELLRLNSLDEAKARKLKPGDRLRVR